MILTANEQAVNISEMEEANRKLLRAISESQRALQPLLEAVLEGNRYSEDARPLSELLAALEQDCGYQDALWSLSVDRLCRHAEQIFAPASGVPLEIDRLEVKRAVGYDREESWRAACSGAEHALPSLAAVWEYLSVTHGSKEAQDAVEEQVVRDFVGVFLRSGGGLAKPKWRKGRLVLRYPIYTEKGFRGGHELTINCRSAIAKDMGLLASMMKVIGATELADAFDELGGWGRWSDPVVSRQRVALPQDSAYVTFFQKIEIELGAEVAADLMARVSEVMLAQSA